jgi:hypothetical protein
LEEANDLVFCGTAGAQEAVAMKMHVTAEENAGGLRDFSGICEFIQLFCGRAYFMASRG